jgi:hypothetical protein
MKSIRKMLKGYVIETICNAYSALRDRSIEKGLKRTKNHGFNIKSLSFTIDILKDRLDNTIKVLQC